MRGKKPALGVVGAVLAVLCGILGAYLDSDVVKIKEVITIPYAGNMETLVASLETYEANTVVAVSFESDGVEIPQSDDIHLEGDTDSAWGVGDILILLKQDNFWVEIGRRLRY